MRNVVDLSHKRYHEHAGRYDGHLGLYADYGRRKSDSWISKRALACVLGAVLVLIVLLVTTFGRF